MEISSTTTRGIAVDEADDRSLSQVGSISCYVFVHEATKHTYTVVSMPR